MVPEDPEALELASRRRIYQLLLDYPGLHLNDVARRLEDLSDSTVRYHLDRLVREGLVSQTQEGGYLRFYPRVEGGPARRDLLDPRQKRALALLRQRVPLGVVLHLLAHGPTSQGDLAVALGVAASTLAHHLDKLRDAELVTKEREGRRVLYRLVDAPAVGDLLYRFEATPDLADAFVDLFEEIGL